MIHIEDFIRSNGLIGKRFYVLGKGPSIEKFNTVDASSDVLISLNHVVRDRDVDIAHIIDFDVWEDVKEFVYENAKYLLMPLHPHVDCKASKLSLHALIEQDSLLCKLDKEKRLLWYKLGTKRYFGGRYPTYKSGYFSGDVIVGVLASAGARNIILAGVDGGNQYSNEFSDLNQKTLLANGRKSFDIQFTRIRYHIMSYDINLKHINDTYPIKVYVATTEAQMLATKVLEYSIRKNTDKPVEFIPMHTCGISYPEPKDISNRQRTPFSFQRFMIPKLNAYSGKAIYLDSDMQVFNDIDRLWSLPMGSSDVLTVAPSKGEGRRLHFSVMLLDCCKLDWDIEDIINKLDEGNLDYYSLMHEMKVAKNISADISEHWNSLEKYSPEDTSLLHYTDMETQPWVSVNNPFEAVWVSDLIEAIQYGSISIDYIVDHVNKGWVRPGLLWQVNNSVVSSKNMPKDLYEKDKQFKPPYKELVCVSSGVSDSYLSKVLVKLKKVVRTMTKK